MANFQFGQNSPYWSDKAPQEENNHSFIKGSAALVGVSGFLGAAGADKFNVPFTKHKFNFDFLYKASRSFGHFTPFGLAISLRTPEMLSSFTTKEFQSNGTGVVKFGTEYLQSDDTVKWLAQVTGHKYTDLDAMGIRKGSLEFNRASGAKGAWGTGDLVFINEHGNRQVLSSNIMLTERASSAEAEFVSKRSINQFAEAMVSTLDENIDYNKFFNRDMTSIGFAGGKDSSFHRWIPVHAMNGEVNSISDLWNRSHFVRGLFAFKAQRLNHAITTIGSSIPIVGNYLKPLLEKHLLTVKPGSSLKTYGRYVGLAGKLAGVGMAVGTYDWFMRYHASEGTSGFVKREAGYTASSAGAGYLALKFLSKTRLAPAANTLAATAAISAFAFQNLSPGFNKGIVAGASQTLTNIKIAKANVGEALGFSGMRRKIEEVLPGFTSPVTTIAAGLAAYGSFNYYHRAENRYYKYYKHVEHLANQKGLGFSTFREKLSSLTDLDISNDAWEKISFNLSPTDDLKQFHSLHSQGLWKKDVVPHAFENRVIEKTISKIWSGSFSQTLGHSVVPTFGKRVMASLVAIRKHLQSSSNAHYKGLYGSVLAFGLGAAAHSLLSFNFLGTKETPEQLQRQANGEELVPVRKSAWWASGGQPYEGGKISYYKPSLNAIIQSDARSKSIWGEDAARLPPPVRWFLKNFTTYLEEKHYKDRPYPISSPAFSDVPFIGKLLAIPGSLIKGPRLMHVDEWARKTDQGTTAYLNIPGPMSSNPNLALGGTGGKTPVSPYRLGEIYGDVEYRLREAAGLVGFVENRIQKFITGEENYSTGGQVLAESGQMTSASRAFWDLELGGLFGQTEIPRRFLPRERDTSRNRYNPLKNQMPSWIPEQFHYGDPYVSMPSGEYRLPGDGFVALHPELSGVDPEDYPIWYKYQILGNISPYSDEFREVKIRTAGMKKRGLLPEFALKIIDDTNKQVDSQKLKRNYFVESEEQKNQYFVTKVLRHTWMNAIEFSRRLAAPIEYLTFGGFRPFQKFLPPGDALDDYERYAIYGSETSFWDFGRAFKDFLGPSFRSTLRVFGWDGIPSELKKKRDIDQFFDRLEYYKYMKLAKEADDNGDREGSGRFRRLAQRTTFGVRATANTMSIYGTLAQPEKDRFIGFLKETDPRKRDRILQLLPDDQKILFSTIWAKQDGLKVPNEAKEQSSEAYKMREVEQYLQQTGMPREDWIGWRKEVDLDDVKLKYIKAQGYESFDFGMWPNQEQLLDQKPYLEGVEQELVNNVNTSYTPLNVAGLSRNINAKFNLTTNTSFMKMNNSLSQAKANIIVNDDRASDIHKEYQRWNEE